MSEELSKELTETVSALPLASFEEELSMMMGKTAPLNGVLSLMQKLGKDEHGKKMLALQVECARRNGERYAALGIGEDVYLATMGCFARFAEEYRQKHGVWGFDCPWWAYRQLNLSIFRIGAYEFELEESGRVGLHIPSGESISPEAVGAGISAFRRFASAHFPAWAEAPVGCHSWLLSPRLTPFLKETSHILAFQRLFVLQKDFPEERQYLGFLFGRGEDTPTGELPERTSLQRAVKAYLLAGGNVGAAYGIFQPGGKI